MIIPLEEHTDNFELLGIVHDEFDGSLGLLIEDCNDVIQIIEEAGPHRETVVGEVEPVIADFYQLIGRLMKSGYYSVVTELPDFLGRRPILYTAHRHEVMREPSIFTELGFPASESERVSAHGPMLRCKIVLIHITRLGDQWP